MKYTRWGDGQELLFDLSSDPLELDDLAHRNDERLQASREVLLDALLDHADDGRGAPVKKAGT